MKGIQGLIVAAGLGVVGMICNLMYLHNAPSPDEIISFLGVKSSVTVNRGEILRDDHLEDLPMPSAWAGSLRDYAVLSKDRSTVVGQPVWRTLRGECLVLNEDLRTPPEELKLEPGDSAIWIPVDNRAFVPALFTPGDSVSFMVTQPAVATPTPAMQPGMQAPGMQPSGRSMRGMPNPEMSGGAMRPVPNPASASESAGTTETIGPFKILALGNRLGSPEVMRAAKMSQVQENVLAIRVSPHVKGEPERAQRLWNLLQATNFRQVGITLHSRKTEAP